MENHDALIVKIFVKRNNLINACRIHKIITYSKYENVLEYLKNRYSDSFSLNETIRRIQYHINEHPKCPICGKYVGYGGYKLGKIIFANTCSPSCGSKLSSYKVKETKLKRYGDENYNNNSKIKETKLEKYGDATYNNHNKTVNTCLRRYGLRNGGGTEIALQKIKETNLKKHGYEMPLQSEEVRNRIKETNLRKYGVEQPLSSEHIQSKRRNTCQKRYGGNSPMCDIQIAEKSFRKRIKNHTWSSSKPEENLFSYIKEKFPNVKRQYKDKERYPWFCDFYIPEIDLFLELNGHWTHGPHIYCENSKYDKKQIEFWKKKYDNGKHPLYLKAIEAWTIYDVKKRETAKKNNLNYKEVWSLQEGKDFIDELYDKMT